MKYVKAGNSVATLRNNRELILTDVPDYFSKRRASFLSGLSRNVIASWIDDGLLLANDRGQVSRASLEARLDRRISADDWNRATVEISRAGMDS
jgi:hypothetical protein